MRIRSLILTFIILTASVVGILTVVQKASAQTFLLDDTPILDTTPIPDDYQFNVLGASHAVVGVRPSLGDNSNIDVYADTMYTTLIASSTSVGDVVDFVTLDKTIWASPPNRGARVVTGASNYTIEMENDVLSYLITDSWGGTMDASPGNPVIDIGSPGSWDDAGVGVSSMIYDGSTYHMWYTGSDGSYLRIGYATSPDGITWTKNAANPVVDVGPPGSWDSYRARTPTVIYDGALYHMWYSGNDGSNYRIGYATSPDGIIWTKSALNPVLNIGPFGTWDDYHIYYPTVLHDGLIYHMWYAGWDGGLHIRIGYATSPDGIAWTKNAANPVLDVGLPGSWDDNTVYTPVVLYDVMTSTYKMWYTGSDGITYRIGYATSPDGVMWAKSAASPVLDVGPLGSWDEFGVSAPGLLYDGVTYHMWYSGNDGINSRIGYANSTDGITWTKFTSIAEVLDAYELSGATIGSAYNIDLIVPATADLDLFLFDFEGDDAQSRLEAQWSSTNPGTGVNESITFIATITGDYLLVITNEDGGIGTYGISITVDNPPTITAYEPGGTAGQTFTKGDLISVAWNASDDNPLPINPINITYGDLTAGWTTVATNELDDGMYSWDTSNVPCPGTYWMNISVYDSVGQSTFDESNYSFDIICPATYPPVIDDVKAGPVPQTVGDEVTISATVTDEDTDIDDLTVTINITMPKGTTLGNFTMTCNSEGECTYTDNFSREGTYTFVIWASDNDDNWAKGEGTFVMECNWKPLLALIFTIILLLVGILVSYKRPIRFKGILHKDRMYTFLLGILPFVIAEAITGLISLFTGLLCVPPILDIGMIVDLIILISGIISCAVILKKGVIPKSYEEAPSIPPTPVPPPPPIPPPPHPP